MLFASSGQAQVHASAPIAKVASTGDDAVAARALDSFVTWRELDSLLLNRHAMSKDGRAALRHQVESRVLELLAHERGIEVPASTVDARWKELDGQIRASGEKEGIASYLAKAKLSREEFEHYLRLAVVQETLTRRALGLDDKAPVTGEQQQLWMDEALAQRNYTEMPPPWKDGIVARCSDFEIKLDEYIETLRRRLADQDIRDDCYQLLLYKRMQQRMPDLAPEKLGKYIEDELVRRRDEANADPRYKGVPYEKLLGAQGILVESLPKDPSIRVAALARAWVDRSYTPDALRRVYNDDREHFDGLYGDAIDTSMLFLRAAEFKSDVNPRSFKEAEAELVGLAAKIASADEFKRIAKDRSEDANTRDNGGALGYVTSGNERVPAEIRAEVARALAKPSQSSASGNGHIAGPVRLPTGCVLLWVGMRRPAPNWETMSSYVQRELRKRFVDDVLQKASVVTGPEAQ